MGEWNAESALSFTKQAFVPEVAQKTLMRMAFVTMSMPVSVNSIHAVCATDPVRFTNVDAQTFLKAVATARATNWMP